MISLKDVHPSKACCPITVRLGGSAISRGRAPGEGALPDVVPEPMARTLARTPLSTSPGRGCSSGPTPGRWDTSSPLTRWPSSWPPPRPCWRAIVATPLQGDLGRQRLCDHGPREQAGERGPAERPRPRRANEAVLDRLRGPPAMDEAGAGAGAARPITYCRAADSSSSIGSQRIHRPRRARKGPQMMPTTSEPLISVVPGGGGRTICNSGRGGRCFGIRFRVSRQSVSRFYL